jgi:hypothetical protein
MYMYYYDVPFIFHWHSKAIFAPKLRLDARLHHAANAYHGVAQISLQPTPLGRGGATANVENIQ